MRASEQREATFGNRKRAPPLLGGHFIGGYRHEYAYADAGARILSSYAVTEPDGTHYVYTMDGSGNDISNTVSMELTVGGAANVYHPGNLPLGTGYIAPTTPHELGAGQAILGYI